MALGATVLRVVQTVRLRDECLNNIDFDVVERNVNR